jgi:hypothetical protein
MLQDSILIEMVNTYLVTLHNPAANPEEYEERYVYADDHKEAELQAQEIVAGHVFNDVSLVSVIRVDPEELYHDEST